MKKRLLSILLMCCMVLTLLPTTAFAEDSAEEPPVCSCETACMAEAMNADCPICGVEGALPENCAKCAQHADDAAVQPEGEVSDPQPEVALTALIGGSETVTDVSTAEALTAAIADSNVSTVRLAGDISISRSLTVTRTVTLDLNGHVLQMTGNDSDPVIEVKKDSIGVGIGNLALTDSNPNTAHKFTPNADGLWVLNEENGTKTVNGGVITGSKEIGIWVDSGYGPSLTQKPAEADCAHLIMTGGNIVGCAAAAGGGVCASFYGYFTMSGGSIRGCVAKAGGGVCLTNSASFAMGGSALIADCISTDGGSCGGGGIGADLGALVALSGNAVIKNCTAQHGGGVYLNNATLTMSENASVTGCNSIAGGGVSARGNATESDPPVFTMEGNSSITDCTALNGGGIFVSTSGGKVSLSGSAKIENCRAVEKVKLEFPEVTGGGVHVSSGSFEMSGGSIESCTAVNGGDSVFVFTGGNSKFTMTGGTVDGSITMPYTVGNEPVYMDGLGTAVSPYQISTAAQLKLFRDIVNGTGGQTQNAGAHAKLMNDIVLNDGTFDENGTYTPGASGKAAEKWTPIAYSGLFNEHTTLYYTGTFDGQGHTIKGLYVSINNATSIGDAVCLGLFSTAKKAVIRNVTVTGYVFGFAGNLGGIVGYLSDGTIENCANYCTVKSTLADTEGPSYVGGIAGAMDKGSVIRDCYNTGTITVVEYREWNMTGGVVGYSDDSAVSNCYNAGKVAGSWNYNGEIAGGSNAGDENGNPSTVSNCYYLDGTGWNAVGNGKGSITNTESKTAAQFANSTVLALLKAGARTGTDPWADECKYLDTAGKTLPVFNGQGDAHDHQSNDWKSNETEHWQVCTCGAVFNKAEHSGGKATCKAKAKCADCGAEYGDTNPNHHGDKLKHVVAKDATTSEEGNIEYWYCEACEKYFSDADAKNEITQAQTVIPKRHSSGGGSGGSSSYPITVPGKTENGTVTVSPRSAEKGDTVTITVKPDSGYQLDDLAVTDKNGKELKLTDKGNGKYIFTMPSGKVKINATFTKEAEPSPFSDVSTSAYYYEAVKWAQEKGITGGIGNGLFGPNRPCTRAQIVTFLWRAAGSPAPKSMSSFTDVPADAFYAKAVAWAVENGITSGTGESKFSPNSTCTRAQAVTFLYRASGSPAVSGKAEFSDVATNTYYADAVAWAAKKGITTGIGGGLFGSDNDCTRGQIVTFLWRCKK